MNAPLPAPSPPFASVEEFVAECGLLESLDRWARDLRRREVLSGAGFQLERTETIPHHRMTVLTGSRARNGETRTTAQVRAAIRRNFEHEGFTVRGDWITIY